MASEQQQHLQGWSFGQHYRSQPLSTSQAPIETIRAYFSLYGEILDQVIMRDKDTNTSRGFGFVTFANPIVCQQVLRLQPHFVDGKQVECKTAVPKEAQATPQMQMYLNNQGAQNIQSQQPQVPQQQLSKKQKKQTQQNQPQNQNSNQKVKNPQSYVLQQQQQMPQTNNDLNQYKKQLDDQMKMIEEQRSLIEMLDRQRQEFTKQLTMFSQNPQFFAQMAQMNQMGNPNPMNNPMNPMGPPMNFQQQDNNYMNNQYPPQQPQQQMQQQNQRLPPQQKESNPQVSSSFKFQDFDENDSIQNSFISLGGGDQSPVNSERSFKFTDTQASSYSSKPAHDNFSLAQQDPQYRKVFVGGLPHNLSDEEFKSYFIQFGEIEDCAILKDKRTGKPRGFGFVTYKDIKTLNEVMDQKDTHTIQGKWVECKRAVPVNQVKDNVPSNPNNISQANLDTPGGPQNFNQMVNNNPQANYNNPANSGYNQGQYPNQPYNQNPNAPNQMQYPQPQKVVPPSPLNRMGQNSNVPSKTHSPSNDLNNSFNSSSQPFYKQNQNQMQGPQQQFMNNNPPYNQGQISLNPPPGLGGTTQQPPYMQNQYNPQQQQQQQYNQYGQLNQQPMYNMNGGYPQQPYNQMQPGQQQVNRNMPNQQSPYDQNGFQSGYPYSNQFKQPPYPQQNMTNGGYPQQQMPGQYNQYGPNNQRMPGQHDDPDWQMNSLNKQYNNMNLDEPDYNDFVDGIDQYDDARSERSFRSERSNKSRRDTIQHINNEIQQLQGYNEGGHEGNHGRMSSVDYRPRGAQHDPHNMNGYHSQQPGNGPSMQRSASISQIPGGMQKSPSTVSLGFGAYQAAKDMPQPQEQLKNLNENRDQQNQNMQSMPNPQQREPVAKMPSIPSAQADRRVGSEGRVPQEDQQFVERRHFLASGATFQFGKDRPSSRHSNDRGNTGKAEFGQIKSQQTQGPSNRADRTYKPY